MTDNPRLPAETIAYIEDLIGADINRDLLKVAIADQDIGTVDVAAPTAQPLNITLDEIKGTQLTGDDWTQLLQSIAAIADALNSNGSDQLRVESPSALDVSASEVDVDLNSQSGNDVTTNLQQVGGTALSGVDIAAALSTLSNAAKSNDTDELVVRVTDPTGTEVRPLTDDVTQAIGDDTLRVTEVNPLSQDFQVSDISVGNGELWVVASSEKEEVNNIIVNGDFVVDGELDAYGDISGSGQITGSGTINDTEV